MHGPRDDLKNDGHVTVVHVVRHGDHRSGRRAVAEASSAHLGVNMHKHFSVVRHFGLKYVRVPIHAALGLQPVFVKVVSVAKCFSYKEGVVGGQQFLVIVFVKKLNFRHLLNVSSPIASVAKLSLVKKEKSQDKLLPIALLSFSE